MPGCEDKDIVIYKPKQVTGTYAEGLLWRGWDICKHAKCQEAAELAKIPASTSAPLALWVCGTVDMKPKPGSLYIHSASEPYNEEQILNQDR